MDDGVPPLTATNTFTVVVTYQPPAISSIMAADGEVLISWSSRAGDLYRLQYKDDLGDAAWIDDATIIFGTDGVVTATNLAGGKLHRFYRVVFIVNHSEE